MMLNKFVSVLLAFVLHALINMLYLVFGVALYIVSMAQVGLTLPMYIDQALLIAFAVVITLSEYAGRALYKFSHKVNHAQPAHLDHYPSA